MENVFRETLNLLGKGDPCVMATVVRTKGSTPQKSGAKLLVRKDGTAVGTLGGGCVEGDIWFAAKSLLKDGGDAHVKDYFLNEDIAARDGLVCGGTMYFLIDPIGRDDKFKSYAQEIVSAYNGGQSVALIELIKTPANSGLKVGHKALIRADGTVLGKIQDELLWEKCSKISADIMHKGGLKYVSTKDGFEAVVQAFTSPPTLLLIGGGHISKKIGDIAKTVGFRIWVVDDRPEYANSERFPDAEKTLVAGYKEGIEQLPVTSNTYIVIATRGHRLDDVALEAAARSPASYVGLVGSKRKVVLIYKELLRRGIASKRLRSIHAPIGLNIGAQHPEEIAISILAEILMAKLGGDGKPMLLSNDRLKSIKDSVANGKRKKLKSSR